MKNLRMRVITQFVVVIATQMFVFAAKNFCEVVSVLEKEMC